VSRRVVALVRDLLLASRIEEAARAAHAEYHRVDSPGELPPAEGVDLLFVAWDERRDDWAEALHRWAPDHTDRPRIILFGPHTDLKAHADARAAGLGPMIARSRLLTALPELLAPRA